MAYAYDVRAAEEDGSKRQFEYTHRKDRPLKVGATFHDLERKPLTVYVVVRMTESVRYHAKVEAKRWAASGAAFEPVSGTA